MIAWWWLLVEGVLLIALAVLATRWAMNALAEAAAKRARLNRVALDRAEAELATCRMKYAELNHGYQAMVTRYGNVLEEP